MLTTYLRVIWSLERVVCGELLATHLVAGRGRRLCKPCCVMENALHRRSSQSLVLREACSLFTRIPLIDSALHRRPSQSLVLQVACSSCMRVHLMDGALHRRFWQSLVLGEARSLCMRVRLMDSAVHRQFGQSLILKEECLCMTWRIHLVESALHGQFSQSLVLGGARSLYMCQNVDSGYRGMQTQETEE